MIEYNKDNKVWLFSLDIKKKTDAFLFLSKHQMLTIAKMFIKKTLSSVIWQLPSLIWFVAEHTSRNVSKALWGKCRLRADSNMYLLISDPPSMMIMVVVVVMVANIIQRVTWRRATSWLYHWRQNIWPEVDCHDEALGSRSRVRRPKFSPRPSRSFVLFADRTQIVVPVVVTSARRDAVASTQMLPVPRFLLASANAREAASGCASCRAA